MLRVVVSRGDGASAAARLLMVRNTARDTSMRGAMKVDRCCAADRAAFLLPEPEVTEVAEVIA